MKWKYIHRNTQQARCHSGSKVLTVSQLHDTSHRTLGNSVYILYE